MQQDPNSDCASVRRRNPRRIAALLAVVAALVAGNAAAQVQRTFINLGFEQPDLETVGCRVYIGEQFVPGWTTSHGPFGQENAGGCTVPPGFVVGDPANIIELWRTPRQTVDAREGSQLAELNAEQLSRLSQNVCLAPGEQIRWRFSHRGRSSATTQDQMRFLTGSDPIVDVGTTNIGTGGVITTHMGTATSVAGPGGWRDYEGSFTYAGVGGVTNIGFEAMSGAATTGNFLDRIQVFLSPFVELTANAFDTVEGTASGLPVLRVVGTVAADITINVSVTGGSAVLGTDFTTPGGGANFTVIVPAGTYDGDTVLPLGLTAIGNSIIDGSRTVELTVQPGPDYVLSSTTTCGDDPIAATVWTLLDDDLDLNIVKTADPTSVAPGDTVNYTLVVTHAGGVDGSGAVVRDPAVAGLDCSAATVTCSDSGGAVCPVSPTIAALQGAGLIIPTLPANGSVSVEYTCTVTATP